MNAPIEELMQIEGIGRESAIAIKLFKDVSVFLALEKLGNRDFITSIGDVVEYLNIYFKGKHYEEFLVIFLNNSNQILKLETVSKGTVNEAKVYIRNIVRNCLNYNSTGIILVHNHPGGSMKPSQSDIDITHKIKTACSYFNIRVLDHFIITGDGYLSLASENLI
jgi:DNA repair protein RadC